jgi:hypothetical protein
VRIFAVKLTSMHTYQDSEVDTSLKMLHVQILADLSDLSQDEFWDKMKRNKCTYLTKNGQDPLSPVRG